MGGETGPALLPGRADTSLMIHMIELPEEDDRHMPPKNKPQVTPEELELLRWWIDSGANTTLMARRADPPAPVVPFLADNYRLLPNPEAEQELQEQLAAARERDQRRRADLIQRLAALSPDLRSAFSFASQDGSTLVFDPISIRHRLTGEELHSLSDLLAECSEVNLAYTAISASTLAGIPFPRISNPST